jgi:hypothetical protein
MTPMLNLIPALTLAGGFHDHSRGRDPRCEILPTGSLVSPWIVRLVQKGLIRFTAALLLVAGPSHAAALEFVRQTIELPGHPRGWQGWRMSCFADLDRDGLQDLLIITPAGPRLLIYRQRPSGFAAAPDQAIELPKGTFWMAPVELDPSRGVQLVVSSASGLGSLRSDRGVFEPLVDLPVQSQPSFAGNVMPSFISLANHNDAGKLRIPVMTPDQLVWFQSPNGHSWSPDPPLSLHQAGSSWKLQEGQWVAASSPARTLNIWDTFRTNAEASSLLEPQPENESVKQLLHEIEDSGQWHGVERVDIDGDGRQDVAIWQVVGDFIPRTDLFVFLRGERFPARPTQILHCRGFPVVGPSNHISPLCQLTRAGRYELVLLTLKTAIGSSRGVVDMAITRGIDWDLTIRTFRGGAFGQHPDTAIPLTSVLPEERGAPFLFWIDGDFNGDGRRDILVRRSTSHWDIIPSSTDHNWFKPPPAASLEIPSESDLESTDLNHDGLADLIALNRREEPARLCIFLSQAAAPAKSSR